MKARITALGFWLCAGAAGAMFIPQPPIPVEFAPIDRALKNLDADAQIPQAQKERLLARLHLLAYVRNTETFPYVGDKLNEPGDSPCPDYDPAETQQGQMRMAAPGVRTTPDQRCANLDYDINPHAEVPQPATTLESPTLAALEHLRQSALHYNRSLELDDRNARARLGYAWALDRLGLKTSARDQLRILIDQTVKEENAGNGNDGAVLAEALTHFSTLAQSRADKKLLKRYQTWLNEHQPPMVVTPILAPLTDAPFSSLTDASKPVRFDIAGTGRPAHYAWPTADAAWLVWDGDGKGKVRNGFDLIGARSWAVFWDDGFQAMRALDDDGNGELSGAELTHLSLWNDKNSDGISQPGEVQPLSAYGIVALTTSGAAQRADLIVAAAGMRMADGSTRPLYDWTPRSIAPKPAAVAQAGSGGRTKRVALFNRQ